MTLQTEDQKAHLNKLVQDLFRLGDYSSWVAPKMEENTSWFFNNNSSYDNGLAVSKRLEELILAGAEIKDKLYLISNVNKIEPVEVALKYGADPNQRSKSGMLPIDRAIYKGRTKIAQALIKNPNFNFVSDTHNNAFILAVSQGKYKLANDILKIKPEFVFSKDKRELSPFYCLAEHVKEKINSKVATLLKDMLQKLDEKNEYYSIAESNKGISTSNQSQVIATLITEYYALKLKKELDDKPKSSIRVSNKI